MVGSCGSFFAFAAFTQRPADEPAHDYILAKGDNILVDELQDGDAFIADIRLQHQDSFLFVFLQIALHDFGQDCLRLSFLSGLCFEDLGFMFDHFRGGCQPR